jgi:SAM-dependent methyltransferase
MLARNVEVQERDQFLGLCSRGQSAFRFMHVTPIHYPGWQAGYPPAPQPSAFAQGCDLPRDGCATTYSMKRRTTLVAAALLGLAILTTETPAAQSESVKSIVDLSVPGLQLKIGSFSADSLTVAQAPEAASPAKPKKEPDIHYVPTPQELVDVMLDMARVGKDDVVYDLGSGDGRLIITAAKKYGASGVGIDIDPQRIAESRENAKKSGVEDRLRFLEQDLFESDFHEATVVTLYLLSELNLRLRPQLFAQLKPGTRVVSHAFMMGDWQPDEHKTIETNGQSYDAYYWVVPANMSGHWKVTGDRSSDLPRGVNVDQKFQKIIVYSGDTGELLGEGKVNGATFTLRTMTKGASPEPKLFQGKIDGDTIQATTSGNEEHRWRATREAGSKTALDASAVN